MTDREIFERVRAHLLKQNARSGIVVTDDDGEDSTECRYRGPDGMMCAVGCLITDEAYDERMESAAVPGVGNERWISAGSGPSACAADALNSSGIPARLSTQRMLEHLQYLHDSRPVAGWAANLSGMDCLFTGEGEYTR